MSLSVLESIALVLYERLLALVDNNSYTINVVEVVRPTRLGNYTPRDMQIVLVQGPEEVIDELMCPGNPPAIARQRTFNIRLHVVNDETSTEEIDSKVNDFQSSVIKAVTIPYATWHNFDGLAIDAHFLSPQDIKGDGGIDGTNLPLAITYRTSENDPYEVRA